MNDNLNASPVSLLVDFSPPQFIIFFCGNGELKISLRDGSVELKDCEIPEAAQAFWCAVTDTFPSIAKAIKNSP